MTFLYRWLVKQAILAIRIMENSDQSFAPVAVFHDSNCQDCLFDTVQEGHDLGTGAESIGRKSGVYRASNAVILELSLTVREAI